MNLTILLQSVVVSAIISGIVSILNSMKKENLEYITAERKEWREKIRELVSNLNYASYEETLGILTQLKVRLNALGIENSTQDYNKDVHIWEVIREIENKKIGARELSVKKKQIISYLALLLKYDWERSKIEVKGNIYTGSSIIMIALSIVYFIISLFKYNCNSDSVVYEIMTVILIYVVLIFALLLLLNKLIYYIGRGMLKNKYKKKDVKYFALYIIYGVIIFIFICLGIIYYIIIRNVFDVICGKTVELCTILLMLLFIAGLAFGCVSQIVSFDLQFNYIDTINRIRNSIEK